MSRSKRNPITGDIETKETYLIGRPKKIEQQIKNKTMNLKLEEEINPLGESKYYLMWKKEGTDFFSPIGYYTEKDKALAAFETAKLGLEKSNTITIASI